MKNVITKTEVLKKTAVFNKQGDSRYELTIMTDAKKGKSILLICLNPASDNVQVCDTTTNYVINNLLPMGYTTITLCNLFSTISNKLKTTDMIDNEDNRQYIRDVLQRDFNTILVGYGNTYTNNKRVNEEKKFISSLLLDYVGKVYEIVDKNEKYSRLKTIHPLFAGQRFSGEWKFRKYIIDELEECEVVNDGGEAMDTKSNENGK